jgi:hypothetical protein
VLPTTAERVEVNTDCEINRQIRERTDANVAQYAGRGDRAIERRLHELDAEWDVERTIECNASSLILVGLGLGALVNRRFYLLPAAVAAFLLQHAVLRRMGFRTQTEIDEERYALKALRGDFAEARTPAAALAAARD